MNKKRKDILIDSISSDMNLCLPTINKNDRYIDSDHVLNYVYDNNILNLNASFKKYGDRVYNVWYDNDNFRFYGMKDLSIYDIYINNDSFGITILNDDNGESCIKKINFYEENNKNLLSVENTYIDNPEFNDYICLENSNNRLSLITDKDVHTVINTSDKKVKDMLKTLLEIEENNIKDSFDLINDSIPRFFDEIKYYFSILNKFNTLYDDNRLEANNIMEDIVLDSKQYKK